MEDLLKRIEEERAGFSKGKKMIADFILEHYEKAAYMTAQKLSEAVKVSESTVVRFANELGFAGYPEFQFALQEIIRNRLTSVQRVEVTNSRIGSSDALKKVLMADANKIRQTLENTDSAAFYRIVETMVNANHLYVVGARSAYMLANFFAFNMHMVFENVHAIDLSSSGEMFEQMLDIGKGDVLFAISFPRYSTRVIKAVQYAKDAGSTVISLTDSADSPIAKLADDYLLARSDMASFVDSLVAPLSMINAIIVTAARSRQTQVTARLHKLESIWDAYEVYDKQKS
ncbi:MAG: MurR/RpiR family transcriptional regulator [Clostridia bacterium]|nr:MurR/RpiR family transcriptional regulator [Clostridia bacterium]